MEAGMRGRGAGGAPRRHWDERRSAATRQRYPPVPPADALRRTFTDEGAVDRVRMRAAAVWGEELQES